MPINNNSTQDPAEQDGAKPVAAQNPPSDITDFAGLLAAVPLGERTLREEIKKGRLPAIRLPGGRRLLFHMPSVLKALLRFQRGGIE